MNVQIIKCLEDNYSYLIIDKNSKTCSAVDPASPGEIIPYIEKKKLNLKNILNTHYHSDHTAGNLELKDKFKCRVGLSDHSKDEKVAMLAIAAGAEVIEKHIALDNQKKGLDIETIEFISKNYFKTVILYLYN